MEIYRWTLLGNLLKEEHMKHISRLTILVLSMIAILIISVGISPAIAKVEPPEGTSLKGPAVLASVILYESQGVSYIEVNNVLCKGEIQTDPPPFPYPYSLNDINSAKDVIGFFIEGAADSFRGCFDSSVTGIVVEAAHDLKRETDGSITMNVVILGTRSR